jgi:hypothetical protein
MRARQLTPLGASTSRAGRSATLFADPQDRLDHLESTRIAALAPSR